MAEVILGIAGAGGWAGDWFFGPSPLNQILTDYSGIIKLDAQGTKYSASGDKFDFSLLIDKQTSLMAKRVRIFGHSHGADEAIDICRGADGNFSIEFSLCLFDPVRRNAAPGFLGLVAQTFDHAPYTLPGNVADCVCFLRSEGGYPIHSGLAESGGRFQNIIVPGSNHNTVCLGKQQTDTLASLVNGGDFVAVAMSQSNEGLA